MKLSCIIIDDEPLAVRLLEGFVQRTPFLELRASYTDSISGEDGKLVEVSYNKKRVPFVPARVFSSAFSMPVLPTISSKE